MVPGSLIIHVRNPLQIECGAHARTDRLCELNVIEQTVNVCQTTVVEGAWERGQELHVHGWIYRLNDGIIRDLKMSVSCTEDIATVRDEAAHKLFSKPPLWM